MYECMHVYVRRRLYVFLCNGQEKILIVPLYSKLRIPNNYLSFLPRRFKFYLRTCAWAVCWHSQVYMTTFLTLLSHCHSIFVAYTTLFLSSLISVTLTKPLHFSQIDVLPRGWEVVSIVVFFFWNPLNL